MYVLMIAYTKGYTVRTCATHAGATKMFYDMREDSEVVYIHRYAPNGNIDLTYSQGTKTITKHKP
jgi:hypothetical protein